MTAPAPAAAPAVMIRPYVAEVDHQFVLSNWRRHISDLSPFSRWSAEEREAHAREVLEQLVDRARPLIAADPADAVHLYGFICGEHQGEGEQARQVMHFLYVSRWCRRRGFATALLRHTFPGLGQRTLYHTHPAAAAVFHRKRWLLRFDPYLVRQP